MLMFKITAPFFGAAALTVLLGVSTSAKRDETLNKCAIIMNGHSWSVWLVRCAEVRFTAWVEALSGSTKPPFFFFFQAFQNAGELLFEVPICGSCAGISGRSSQTCQLGVRNDPVS